MVVERPAGGGPSQPIEIDPYDLYAAGQIFAGGELRFSEIATRLRNALDACGGMAGDDEGGRRFAGPYDRAAGALTNVLAATDPALSGMSAGLVATANNFLATEHASTAGASGAVPSYPLPGLVVALTLPPTASALGAGPGGVMADVFGEFWAAGHQDRLRTAAAAYRTAASAVRNLGGDLQSAVASITDYNSSASIDAMSRYFAAIWNDQPGATAPLSAAYQACGQLANACERLAAAIDTEHSDVENGIGETGLAMGITSIIGALGSLFTGGGSDALAGWADSAEGAAILGPILDTFLSAVDEILSEAALENVVDLLETAANAVPTLRTVDASPTGTAQSAAVTRSLDQEMATTEHRTTADYDTQTPQQRITALAQAVGTRYGVAVTGTKSGYKLTIPLTKRRDIIIRVGSDPNWRDAYYRVSVAGGAAYTVSGAQSTDPTAIHIEITPTSLADIMAIIETIKAGS